MDVLVRSSKRFPLPGPDQQFDHRTPSGFVLFVIAIGSLGAALFAASILLSQFLSNFHHYRWSIGIALSTLIIAIFLSLRSIRRDGPAGAIHAIFLLSLTIFMCLSSILISILDPTLTYNMGRSVVLYMEYPTLVQSVVLVFVLAYGVITLWPLRRTKPTLGLADDYPSWVKWLTLLALGLGSSYLILPWVSLPPLIVFALNALRIYLVPYFVIVGWKWSVTPWSFRLLIAGTLMATSAIKLIGNAREAALLPIIFIGIGYMISPGVSHLRKLGILSLGICLLPWLLLLGNQSRLILGPVGEQASFADRVEAVESTVGSGDIVSENGPWLDMATRFYPMGANAIIAFTPDLYEFVPFRPEIFGTEAFKSMLPSAISGTTQLDDKQYIGSTPLRRYGFLINENTSVEINVIGSLYLLGGIIPVMIGGFLLAIFHRLAIFLINVISLHRPELALLLLSSAIGVSLDAISRDTVTIASSLLTSWIVCGLLYLGFSLLGAFRGGQTANRC